MAIIHLPVNRVYRIHMPRFIKKGISFALTIAKMTALILPDALAFREKPDGGNNRDIGEQKTSDAVLEDLSDSDDAWLLCRQCNQKIAKPTARISINGSHRHTFANPNGIVFEIGCFNQVHGCNGYGQPSMEFAWFAGFSWQIMVCSQCHTHLGWFFSSGHSTGFSGLILDRLIEQFSKK